jgi:hypothetical protein
VGSAGVGVALRVVVGSADGAADGGGLPASADGPAAATETGIRVVNM